MNSAAARRILISLIALLPAAPAAGAGSHTITVRVSNGQTVYTQKVPIMEGSQNNFTGPVKAAGGGQAQLIFNGLLSPGGAPGTLTLQYQLELNSSRGSQSRTFQVQSEVDFRPGEETTVVKCGPFTLALGIDLKPGAKKASGDAWNPAGLPNYRLTGEMRAGGSKEQCRLVSKAGVQSNVTDARQQGGRKYGFIFNALFAKAGGGKDFSLQYQMELSANPLSKAVQTQNTAELALNKKTTFSGQNYRLDFLLEGGARPKQNGGGGKQSEPKKEYGTVQPL